MKRKKKSVAFHPRGFKGMDAIDIMKNIDAEVVLELTSSRISDGEPGLSHIKTALNCGKHVITANKISLAKAWHELMDIASSKRLHLKFSGAVGGGTPILNLAKNFHYNEINSIYGILNGTSNYILTRMAESNMTMNAALKEAQTEGFTEADPSYDIDGIDTACKLVILANLAIHREVSIGDVHIEGIRNIKVEDIKESVRKNCSVRLIGSIDNKLIVRPKLVPRSHPLCVDGILNAVLFKTEFSGDITIIGRGVGGRETASAILRDLIELENLICAH